MRHSSFFEFQFFCVVSVWLWKFLGQGQRQGGVSRPQRSCWMRATRRTATSLACPAYERNGRRMLHVPADEAACRTVMMATKARVFAARRVCNPATDGNAFLPGIYSDLEASRYPRCRLAHYPQSKKPQDLFSPTGAWPFVISPFLATD